jgi:hypothetical protein
MMYCFLQNEDKSILYFHFLKDNGDFFLIKLMKHKATEK